MSAIRRSERAVRESEENFRLAFEHAPIGKALIGLDFAYEKVNPAMCDLTGHSPEQMVGLSVADTSYPEDLASDMTAMAALISGAATTYTHDERLVTQSGAVVWVAKSVALLRDVDGEPVRFIAQLKNIGLRKEQESALLEERRRLHAAESIGRTASWELDASSDAVTWSNMLFELYGIEREGFTADYQGAIQCVEPADRERVHAAIEAARSGGEPMVVRYRVRRRSDGELRWFDARGACELEDGRVVRIVGAVADVTDQVLAAAEVGRAHAFEQAIIRASPDITFVYDVGARSTIWINRSVAEALGYDPQELAEFEGDLLGRLIPPADRESYEAALAATHDEPGNDVIQFNHRMIHADGTLRWFSRRSCPLKRDDDGHVLQLVGALRDITDAVASQEKLQHSALHDGLTGLPNRGLLVDRLDTALSRSQRDQREIAVLFCDLDGFKRINDTVGHAAGDAVLTEIAARLQGVLRENDTVARVGGDEFVMVVEPWNRDSADVENNPGGDRQLAIRVAERISEVLLQPVIVDGVECKVTASIGVAYGRLSGDARLARAASDELLRDADAAMYRAKGRGKDRFEVFEHGLVADLIERGRVEQVLRRALDSGESRASIPGLPAQSRGKPELSVAYQPVFESSGMLTGFEALARLTDADGGNIAPDVFIGVAEEAGVIRQLGARMLGLACGQLAYWRATVPGFENITMAVNVSALQAQHPSLLGDVREALGAYGLCPSDIVLELTETVLFQAAHSTIDALRLLHEEGAGIAIDDFGTGYSSLRYLATLPVSAIKVDKSFTAGLPGNAINQKIVKAVAALAADMSLTCIIEGVETEEQRAALPPGVQLQGYLTGRPQSPQSMNLLGLITAGVL